MFIQTTSHLSVKTKVSILINQECKPSTILNIKSYKIYQTLEAVISESELLI